MWAPFYTIHKIMAGMFDMYRLAGNTQALQVLEGMAAWADAWTASKTDEHMQQILAMEFGGIAETLYNLAAATGNDRWASVGDRFQKRSFINPLALRRDELRGLHANTHIPQAIAAARRYEISGDIAVSRRRRLLLPRGERPARSYVTGGTSNAEGLARRRRGGSRRSWKASANTAECCCAYNMLKLTRHLYAWNRDPRYFDYYERLLLNHRIGTIRPNVGTTQYYLSLTPGVWKTFNTEDQTFWCCTGTGIEEYAKLADSIYWRDDDGIYVNLFIAVGAATGPTRRPAAAGDDLSGMRAHRARRRRGRPPASSTIRLRVPGWLATAPVVKLNGKPLDASAAPGQLSDASAARGRPATAWKWRCRCICTWKRCRTIRGCRRFSTVRWCWPAISATTA